MKKSYVFLTACIVALMLLFTGTTMGQNLITENFDSYTADQKLVQQGAPNWTTWSNQPGSAEDPFVRNTQSHSTANSVEIAGTNDAVLLFNDKTTGRYSITMYVYIPSGEVGYYNLLQNFAGASSTWGMQTYFDEAGTGLIDAGGAGTGSFFYSYNTWIKVTNTIDLDEDFATVYIDDEYVVDWQWSVGAFGQNNELKLDAMNLYAWTGGSGGSTPGMFADDITFDQLTAPDPAQNLQAVVDINDVTLTWDAPASGTPTAYRIYRDGGYLASTTDLTYLDADVYFGDHEYYIRAEYTDQLSAKSNTVTAVIEGGVDRQYVVLEIATGTWCQYCPGAAMGADELVEDGAFVGVIEYHSGDDYEITASTDRIAYYGIDGYPTAEFDGIEEVVGGSTTQSMYPTYLPIYEARIDVKSLFTLQLTVDWADNTNVLATVVIEKQFDYTGGDLFLRLALTESNIPESWYGMTEIDYVCRAMYPDANGTLVDFSSGNLQTFQFPISIPDTYVWENLELVAFMQDDASMETMQTGWFPLTMTAMPEKDMVTVSASPNPVQDQLTIRSGQIIKSIRVVNSMGQQVGSFATDSQEVKINTASWNTGMYYLNINTTSGNKTVKVIKN